MPYAKRSSRAIALIWQALGGLALLIAAGLAVWAPIGLTMLWMAAVETTPELWHSAAAETIIGVEKAAGIGLLVALGLRFGWRRDRYNPGFAFLAMFFTGIAHGLYPGLTLTASLRTLVGSAAPFGFSFVGTGAGFYRAVSRMAMLGPLINLGFGALLSLLHLHSLFDLEAGSFRLAGAGLPAFLGGFALIAVYAGLLDIIRTEDAGGVPTMSYALLALNAGILLLTGARAPLALAALLGLGVAIARRRIMLLAGALAAFAIVAVFASQFSFIRAVNLLQGGQAANLSNRNLIWPYFEAKLAASPWVGWGVGAGKEIVPTDSLLASLIGTTAAHNEYLRIGTEGGAIGLALLILMMALWACRGSRPLPPAERWFMRFVFVAFAIHSATDNTLIATTSSVLFIWASAVFSAAANPYEEAR